jgi:hypothetical protein
LSAAARRLEPPDRLERFEERFDERFEERFVERFLRCEPELAAAFGISVENPVTT